MKFSEMKWLNGTRCTNRENFNIIKVPLVRLKPNDEGAKKFNEFYQELLRKIDEEKDWHVLKRTKSYGISKKRRDFRLPGYSIISMNYRVELLVIDENSMCYRVLFGARDIETEDEVSGREAFNDFCAIARSMGVNIEDFAVYDGKEVKKTIETYRIDANPRMLGREIEGNIYHIDLNSSFFAGIAEEFPELRDTVTHIYDMRKTDNKYKNILTHTYGYFQCQWCIINHHGYALANLSKAAVEVNNRKLFELDEALVNNGDVILAHNTDGIWYWGPQFHSSTVAGGEGNKLGQWKTDKIATRIRFKSKGSYEYEDSEGYHAVVRGLTNLDKLKPREEWEWGDIMKETANMLTYYFEEGEGVIER